MAGGSHLSRLSCLDSCWIHAFVFSLPSLLEFDKSSSGALKLQREREKAKKDKKERKKEKREKARREKKEKSGEYDKSKEKKHSSEERGKDNSSQISQELVDHKKRKHEEIEQVERSSVTEEHGQPVATQSLYDSSDSTQSSAKRKKHDMGAEADHNHSELFLRLLLVLPCCCL